MSVRLTHRSVSSIFFAAVAAVSFGFQAQQHKDGYRDSPILPGQKWRVHDVDRPYPAAVVPGKKLGDAPSDAEILFDGKDLSKFVQFRGANEIAPTWKIVDGCLEVVSGAGYLYTKDRYGDCQLHIEWQESKNIKGSGQGRGNSGVFLMSRYEIQVLDSYKAATYADGQAGAMYGQWPPLVNPIRKLGEWQSYDIIFEAPKFEGNKVVKPAFFTVIFNGVLVHHHQQVIGKTIHGQVAEYEIHGAQEPLALQDHGPAQPLRFRNIWIRRLKGYDQPEQ